MKGTKTVNTPLGKIEVRHDKTSYSNATTTIAKIKKDIEKIANSGTVPTEKLKENEAEHLYVQ